MDIGTISPQKSYCLLRLRFLRMFFSILNTVFSHSIISFFQFFLDLRIKLQSFLFFFTLRRDSTKNFTYELKLCTELPSAVSSF